MNNKIQDTAPDKAQDHVPNKTEELVRQFRVLASQYDNIQVIMNATATFLYSFIKTFLNHKDRIRAYHWISDINNSELLEEFCTNNQNDKQ